MRGHQEFGSQFFHGSGNLFRGHFVLFHLLYRLHQDLLSRGPLGLDIHTTAIRLVVIPGSPTDGAMTLVDPMQQYYLNIENLTSVDDQDVVEMLHRFWGWFERKGREQEALTILELEAGVGMAQIKERYRELARKHHPDNGGDAHRMQQINRAMEILKGF